MRRILICTVAALVALALASFLPEAQAQRLKRSRSGATTTSGQDISYLKDVEKGIVRFTNDVRRQHGLPVLSREPTLNRIARAHSEDMLANNYFNHVGQDGSTPHQRITSGYPFPLLMTGENIWAASGTHPLETERMARIIVDTWMSSAGHRENILKPDFTDLGVGVASSGKTVRATQVFIQIKK